MKTSETEAGKETDVDFKTEALSCTPCPKRDQCKTPCKAVKKYLWKDNFVMEKHYEDRIVCYPEYKQVHFSALENYEIEDFSSDDVVPWKSEDCRLRKTSVFIDRFFFRIPYKDLAVKYRTRENTLVATYSKAVAFLEKLITAMDARKEGLKSVQKETFTEEQKYFLLVKVFGFTGNEVAKMFSKSRQTVNSKVGRMTEQFEALFDERGISDISAKQKTELYKNRSKEP